MKYVAFKNHIYMIGFGSIGAGTLPLILRHIDVKPEQITIITADDRGHDVAKEHKVKFIVEALTSDNYREVLGSRLQPGDFVVNVSVDVASTAIIELCQEKAALYIDTVIEPWAGHYTDPTLSATERSNYGMRETALALQPKYAGGHTAVLCHGANPGIVNHFVKKALLDMARDTGVKFTVPKSQEDWGKLSKQLGIKVVHIAERDTQVCNKPKEVGEFINTWSIDGFYSEGRQPAELGWGTHEKQLPDDGVKHPYGCDASIYLNRPGCTTRVRSWTPLEGPYHGFLITHNESISIADYLTLRDKGKVRYRPTCHYAYHPCDGAVLSVHELNGKNGALQANKRLLGPEDITKGMDELGVLLMGNKKGVYWYGSRLTIDQARQLAPYNTATSLQVTVAVLSGMIWAIENPKRGLVEPEQMDYERVLEIAVPYLGDVVGVWGEWSPLQDRGTLFPEDIDTSDPWQFKNIRVV
ncbi:MAG: homospermidine synthase [Alphaproteobacteria bacterium]|nr:homospermidine synthase [Alphaproteobacteria bacterium]